MSKTLILITVLLVGCATTPMMKSVIGTYEFKAPPAPPPPPTIPTPQASKSEPPKTELTSDSAVGDTHKIAILKNGIVEIYINGEKVSRGKWSIVKEEIHFKTTTPIEIAKEGLTFVFRINEDKSITQIAFIHNFSRMDYSKKEQITLKKIK